MVNTQIQQCQKRLPILLKNYLPAPESVLIKAMHYACLNGGKRLRPLLTYLSAQMFDVSWDHVDPIAAAIEFIHCYSLIHDDLPAMDNDDLRRGQPTCHKMFNEATAILAGDALLTLAFHILTQDNLPFLDSQKLAIIKTLSHAAGTQQGMVQGQAADLAAQGNSVSLEQLIAIHQAKTGALIAASVQCGALATHATETDRLQLQQYGETIGLAFQIQDDILDAQGCSQMLGKHTGQDAKKNKCTFVTVLGLKSAQEYGQYYYSQALACLDHFGAKAQALRELATFMVHRTQ